jgi:hypothetical protein
MHRLLLLLLLLLRCRCVVPQLPHMTGQGLAIVAVGLAELNHIPPQQFTSYLLELFHKQLAAATPGQAACFIWALPRLLLQLTHSQAAAAAAADGEEAGSVASAGSLLQQQQQQQQQRNSGGGAAAGSPAGGWLRQYCWLLQVGCGLEHDLLCSSSRSCCCC